MHCQFWQHCPMKLRTIYLLRFTKDLIELGFNLLSQNQDDPLKVVGKALHIISYECLARYIRALYVLRQLSMSFGSSKTLNSSILILESKGQPMIFGVRSNPQILTTRREKYLEVHHGVAMRGVSNDYDSKNL